jgi:hypothetical protein
MAVQEVAWDMAVVRQQTILYFFYGNGSYNHQLGRDLFVHNGIRPAVKGVQFVSDRVSYIVARSHWCDIVLNVHDPTDHKSDDTKDSIYEEQEYILDQCPKCRMRIFY